jgi:hypothetical protein
MTHLFFHPPLLERPCPSSVLTPQGNFSFGHYAGAITHPDFSQAILRESPWFLKKPHFFNGLLRRWRLKEWHYLSLQNDQTFFALGMIDLGYASHLFYYLVDKNKSLQWEGHQQKIHLFPHFPKKPIHIAESSISGISTWYSSQHQVSIKNDSNNWSLSLSLPLHNHLLEGSLTIQRTEALSLVYPISKSRGMYTHKEAGNQASGQLNWGTQSFNFQKQETFAVSDWTRGFAKRKTTWKWVSFAGQTLDHKSLGLNLSENIYGEFENAFWLDGHVFSLGKVSINVPPHPEKDQWLIESPVLSLTFTPIGARKENTDWIILSSKFIQPYGYFNGYIRHQSQTYLIDQLFGVVENHQATW